ncbi:hypothetical protein BD410DRAFT_637663 [Rickenella mellea]|uniref:SET domain-containing protein n=1 Tax=Rickenella mellea TaxID=50990 RepID=A0A4Y7QDG2_9AGAM|nr:hypothetical protein BD410DRAFT_637663 [Rickenella mellea]
MKDVGGGRGVFVTRDVKIGELLMVCKPIACSPKTLPDKERFTALHHSSISSDMSPMSSIALWTKVAEKMWEDPSCAATISALYAGSECEPATDYPPALPSDSVYPPDAALQSCADIDVTRIERVCTLNSFGVIPLSKVEPEAAKPPDPSPDAIRTGLYALPSLCNHSCLPAVSRMFFGDVLVMRACRNLKKGDEVTLEYLPGEMPFPERQDALSKFDFICHCALCEADRADGDDARQRRELIASKFDAALWKNPEEPTLSRAAKFLSDMEQTFRDTEERQSMAGYVPNKSFQRGFVNFDEISRSFTCSCIGNTQDAVFPPKNAQVAK